MLSIDSSKVASSCLALPAALKAVTAIMDLFGIKYIIIPMSIWEMLPLSYDAAKLPVPPPAEYRVHHAAAIPSAEKKAVH